jgi:hypothetical protein
VTGASGCDEDSDGAMVCVESVVVVVASLEVESVVVLLDDELDAAAGGCARLLSAGS